MTDGLVDAVAQAVSEGVAITRSGSARFEHPTFGIGGLLLGFEFGHAGFRRRSGGGGCGVVLKRLNFPRLNGSTDLMI